MKIELTVLSFFACFLLSFIITKEVKKHKAVVKKLPCEKEYTKIEFGKGVNCKGDTITIFEYSQHPIQ